MGEAPYTMQSYHQFVLAQTDGGLTGEAELLVHYTNTKRPPTATIHGAFQLESGVGKPIPQIANCVSQ